MHNGEQDPAVDLVSSSEVAAALGVSTSTVSRMVTAGRIAPAFQASGIRGSRYFRRADLERLVTEEREALQARLQRMSPAVPA